MEGYNKVSLEPSLLQTEPILAEGALDPTAHVANKVVKQRW